MSLVKKVRQIANKPLYTVFGSAAPRPGERDYEIARAVGRLIASKGFGVVNGGYGGVMDASARGASDVGGISIGITIDGAKWSPSRRLTHVVPAPSHTDRLLALTELGDGYIVMPGGTGTLLELAFVWESFNKGLLNKRPLILFGSGWNRVADEIVAVQPWAEKSITRASSLDDLEQAFHQLIHP
jgi:uncharacterized protein (TIGR00730 family)